MGKTLVIGWGTLGSSFGRPDGSRSGDRLVARRKPNPGQFELDITQDFSVNTFFESHPDIHMIINCAAQSNVDACEKDPDAARSVNSQGVKRIALKAQSLNIPLIHISTDYVFSGQSSVPYGENDSTGPISVYGLSKLEGEFYALNLATYAAVVRTSWLYGGEREDFVSFCLNTMASGGPLSVNSDQRSTPTRADELAEKLLLIAEDLLEHRKKGKPMKEIFHLSNEGACSRYEMALRIQACAGHTGAVSGIPRREIRQWIAARPRFTVMSKDKFKRRYGTSLKPWQESLEDYLQGKKNR